MLCCSVSELFVSWWHPQDLGGRGGGQVKVYPLEMCVSWGGGEGLKKIAMLKESCLILST